MEKQTDINGWPEVVIRHPVEVAEALSYFLFELGALGLEQTQEPQYPGQMISAANFRPTSDTRSLSAELSCFLDELGQIFDLRQPIAADWRMATPGDWTEKWKEGLTPIEIGATLVIKPSWCDFEAKGGQRIIEIDPGMAFGTGRHASTYMCLEIIEDMLPRTPEDCRILDLGTGSGILALACAALGRERIVAVDIDPLTLPVAAENFIRNGLDQAVRLACAGPQSLVGVFDLITANLTALDLIRLSRDLRRLASDKADVVLSGILTEQAREVIQAFQALGFSVQKQRELEEWTALVLKTGHR